MVAQALAIANALTLFNAALATAANAMQVAQKISNLVQRAQIEGRPLTDEELMALFDEGDELQAKLLEKLKNPELPLGV